jgi:hypothetical protein
MICSIRCHWTRYIPLRWLQQSQPMTEQEILFQKLRKVTHRLCAIRRASSLWHRDGHCRFSRRAIRSENAKRRASSNPTSVVNHRSQYFMNRLQFCPFLAPRNGSMFLKFKRPKNHLIRPRHSSDVMVVDRRSMFCTSSEDLPPLVRMPSVLSEPDAQRIYRSLNQEVCCLKYSESVMLVLF